MNADVRRVCDGGAFTSPPGFGELKNTSGVVRAPQGVVIRVFAAFVMIVAASAASMFERIFQNAAAIKSENDLTV